MGLFDYQEAALARVSGHRRCAFYHDMGLGKTFTGSEKLKSLHCSVNVVVCQKSKVEDWVSHLRNVAAVPTYNLTNGGSFEEFTRISRRGSDMWAFGVINYDLLFRRDITPLVDYAVMFDESSLLQNESSKRTKAAMRLASGASGLVLLSGTPTDGKYERLWTQLRMLGWDISKDLFWRQYVDVDVTMVEGFPIKTVRGYKNERRLAAKMVALGCDFLKTSDVVDLPKQRFVDVGVRSTEELRRFRRDRVVDAFGRTFVGDTTFGAMMGERMLAAAYSAPKLQALVDTLGGTCGRVVVFYNFDVELAAIVDALDGTGRQLVIVNGRSHDLRAFHTCENAVALVQYQAGAMGLNMQDAAYTVYFSPPLASSLYEQSKKRTHRIGQSRPCTYYRLVTHGSVEERIYATLEMRRDYTERLFEMGGMDGR